MVEMTYLKELRDEDDTIVISFEGNALDVYALRDYANIINSAQEEVEEEYYSGFNKNNNNTNNDCEIHYGMADEEVNKVVDTKEDVVNHPHHYAENGAMECIDEMILLYGEEAVMNFCLCNMHKYRYRANMKGGAIDKQKSDWYVAKYKELKEIVEKRKYDRYSAFMKDAQNLLMSGASLHIEEPEFIELYKKFVPCDLN